MKKNYIYYVLVSAFFASTLLFAQPAAAFDFSKFLDDLWASIGWGGAGRGNSQAEIKDNLGDDGKPLPPGVFAIDDSKINLDKFKSNGRCNRYAYFPFGQPQHIDAELNQRSLFLCRQGYAMQYDPKNRNPVWAAFIFNPEEVKKWPSYKRGYLGGDAEPHRDPDFPKSIQSTPAAMFAKGYLWAYLSPMEYGNDLETDYQKAAATAFAEEQQRTTNVIPWVRGGQGVIEKMYAYLRYLSVKSGALYVVDGPLYLGDKPLDTISVKGGVQAVPTHMFVVVTIKDDFSTHGFIIPNNIQALNGHEITDFAVNIKEVERLTHLNFHSILQPYEEKKLEGSVTDWKSLAPKTDKK